MNNKDTVSIWSRDFILLLIINGTCGLSFQILAPNLPVYARQIGFSESLIGVLVASLAFGALLSRPFAGPMADTMNRKKICVISMLMTSVAVISLEFASIPPVLIGIRFFHGILFGLNTTVTLTMASAVTPESKMGRGVGIFGITGIGAQAIAPAIGIAVVNRWGFPVLFLITAGISALAASLVPVLSKNTAGLKNGADNGGGRKFSIKNIAAPDVIGFACIAMFFTGVTSSVTNFMVLYGLEKGITNVGFYFTVFALVLIATRIYSGTLTDRYSFRLILYPCCVCCASALIVISFANSFPVLAVAAVLMGTGYGISTPTVQTAAIRAVEPSRRGIAVATVFAGTDLAHCTAPVLMGIVTENAGYSIGYRAMCSLMILTVPVIIFTARKKKKAGGAT
ncbi:MAG: MFS transporter [Oscillospiraceae bacterium]|nr:MFS transporter [Oscillospiraceae bacterium]